MPRLRNRPSLITELTRDSRLMRSLQLKLFRIKPKMLYQLLRRNHLFKRRNLKMLLKMPLMSSLQKQSQRSIKLSKKSKIRSQLLCKLRSQ